MTELLQSTAQTVVGRGYLSSDHISTATGLDPAITISKNGGNFANPAAGASVMTEIESTGWYKFTLGTGDTDTLGPLIVRGTHATMDNIEVVFQVVAVSVAQTGDAYAIVNHVDYGNAKLVRSTTPANTLTVDASHQALADVNAVSGDSTAADRLEAILDATPGGAVVDDNDPDPTATAFETNLTEATNDHYNGAFVVFTSGALLGQSRKIADYDGSTKVLTVATAFTEAPAAGDTFIILGRSE